MHLLRHHSSVLVDRLLLHHIAILNHDVILRLSGHALLELLLCSLLLLKVQLLLSDLPLMQECSALQEPLGVASDLTLRYFKCGIAHVRLVLAFIELLVVHILVHAVHLTHFFDLIKVHYEAALVRVILFDAFAAEDGLMIRTIEVLHALIVPLTEQALDTLFIFKVDVAQDRISLYYLVQYIEVKWQLVDGLDLLDQLEADGTSASEILVQASQTFSAESMAAMHEYARNLLAHIELVAAIIAKVEATRLIISLNNVLHGCLTLSPLLMLA